MNWLATLLAKMFGEVLNWGQKNAEKPNTTEDAKTPDAVKRGWSGYLRERLKKRD